jgi:hypothetical protein
MPRVVMPPLLKGQPAHSPVLSPPDPPPTAPALQTTPLHPPTPARSQAARLKHSHPLPPAHPTQGDAYLAAYRDHKPGALAAHEAAGRMVHDVIDLAWLRRCEASGQLEPVK